MKDIAIHCQSVDYCPSKTCNRVNKTTQCELKPMYIPYSVYQNHMITGTFFICSFVHIYSTLYTVTVLYCTPDIDVFFSLDAAHMLISDFVGNQTERNETL